MILFKPEQEYHYFKFTCGVPGDDDDEISHQHDDEIKAAAVAGLISST